MARKALFYKWIPLLLASLALLVPAGGCEDTVEFVNSPPSGLAIERGKCTIWTGGAMMLKGSAQDNDDDPVSFTWTANAGSFTPPEGTGEEVTWTAPDMPGSVIITLEASDGIDSRTLSITVEVGEEFPSIIFGTVEISDRGYPYIIAEDQPVTVAASANLIIGPGVELVVDSEFGGLDIRGAVTISGRPDNRVTIGPNNCAGVTKSWGGIYLTGGFAQATIKNANVYAGMDGIQLNEGAGATIDSCTIIDQDESAVSVLDGSSAVIRNCKLWDNRNGIFVRNSDFTLWSSTVRYNRGKGVYVTVITEEPVTYDMSIEECEIANNGIDGILLEGEASPEIHGCSLFFNGPEEGAGYAVRLSTYTATDTVHAEYNYWGDTTAVLISEQILDRSDDPGRIRAYVGFTPWLYAEP